MIRADSREILRLTVLWWITPLPAARCISGWAACKAAAAAVLAPHAGPHARTPSLAVVVADGLSAAAAERHAVPLLARLLPALQAEDWSLAPLVVLRQARVAAGDAVAAALGAGAVLVLIGERPGLSAPDSLGAYVTWAPHPATTDADRNCVSNIRPAGLSYDDAAFRLAFLLRAMRAGGVSGVGLKDGSEAAAATTALAAPSFPGPGS